MNGTFDELKAEFIFPFMVWTRNDSRDDEKEILEWQEWNKESATDVDGILLKGYKGSFPRRQMESGKSFGLSLLLNPRLEEYFCTSSDSTGFRVWQSNLPEK